MNRIFDMEGPLFSGLSKIADLFWLNILFLICCIPVVTIGASTTALYYVTMKMVKNEDCYITKSFFKSFKLNFRQSTVIWLIFLVAYYVLYLDYKIMGGAVIENAAMNSNVSRVVTIVLFAVGIFITFTITYVFPVLAKFYNTIKLTLRNAFLMSVRHFPYTLLLIFLGVFPFVLMYFFNQLIILFFIIIFSLIAYVSSYIYVKIFSYYLPKEETEKDPDDFSVDMSDMPEE